MLYHRVSHVRQGRAGEEREGEESGRQEEKECTPTFGTNLRPCVDIGLMFTMNQSINQSVSQSINQSIKFN